MNIGIMRAFVAIRHMVNTLPQPDATADVAQLRKDFENLKLDIEDILHDQNDINESTRAQLDAISTALSELQAKEPRKRERNPIGFIKPEKKAENTPPPVRLKDKSHIFRRIPLCACSIRHLMLSAA
jgi:hypothetical protein